MGIPLIQQVKIAKYLLSKKLSGQTRYPLAMMLEPLFQCNLECAGCGKIDHPQEILKQRMSVEDALRAADESGAPGVSVPGGEPAAGGVVWTAGGEPLIHKELPQIVQGLIVRKKFVYLCTNAILMPKHI